MKFDTEEATEKAVSLMSRRGSSISGRFFQYPVCWILAYLFLWPLGQVGLRTFPKTKGTEYLKVDGPVIIISNHRSLYDYLWIAMCTMRHIRPLQKIAHFKYRRVGAFLVRGGALPIPQAAKPGERALSDTEKLQRGWLLRAVQAEFTRWIREGRCGLVFAQGTRRKDEKTIGPIRPAIYPLFDYQASDVDPQLVFVGLTADALVAHPPILCSQMPSELDTFLQELRERMQRAFDEAKQLR